MRVLTHCCAIRCSVDADLMCDWDLARAHFDRVFDTQSLHELGAAEERAWSDFHRWYCDRRKTVQPFLWLNLSTGASCLFTKKGTEEGHYVPRTEDR